jgi:hypothetical protein
MRISEQKAFETLIKSACTDFDEAPRQRAQAQSAA